MAKSQKKTGWFVLIIVVMNLLVACGSRETKPTPVAGVGQIVRATPTPVLDNNPPLATLPPPTPVYIEATVTPLPPAASRPTPGILTPTLDNNTSPDPSEIDASLGGGSSSTQGVDRSNLTEEDLPGQNGGSLLSGGGAAILAQPTLPPLKANYGSKGQPRIGIQAGHWQIEAVPAELSRLRGQTGGKGGGIQEVDVTLDLARRVVKLLQDKGYEVDLLPATVPVGYTADAFVAIHADATDESGSNGFKLARGRFSAIPTTDDALLNALSRDYDRATGLGHSASITPNMTGYYAFNNLHSRYAVSKVTPAVIIETGYLTNPDDRLFLVSHPDKVADGIAGGVVDFLNGRPPLAQREKAASTITAIEISFDNTPVLDKFDGTGKTLLSLNKGQKLENYGVKGDYYLVWLPTVGHIGFVARDKASLTTLPR